MITKDKITEIFCILDEFSKNFDAEMQHHSLPTGSPKARRRRKASLSDSEIMTILLVFHFGTFPLKRILLDSLHCCSIPPKFGCLGDYNTRLLAP